MRADSQPEEEVDAAKCQDQKRAFRHSTHNAEEGDSDRQYYVTGALLAKQALCGQKHGGNKHVYAQFRHVVKEDVVARQHAGNSAGYRGDKRQEKPQIKVSAEARQKKAREDEEVVSARSGIQGIQEEEGAERLRLHIRG